MNDKESVQMVKAESTALIGFAEACERIYESACRVALATVHSVADAEDVVQESFAVVFENVHGGTEIDNLDHYLLSTVSRRAIELAEHRRRKVKREIELDELLVANDDPATEAIERNALIMKASASVLPQYRQAVWLHDQEGLTQDEVGALMGTSADSAQKLVKRGREQLGRRYLELAGARPGEPAECGKLTDRFWRMVTQVVPDGERTELEAHAKSCRFCTPKLEDLRVAAAYGIVFPVAIAALTSKRKEIIQRVFSRPVGARSMRPLDRFRTWPTVAALVLVIVIPGWIHDQPVAPVAILPAPVTSVLTASICPTGPTSSYAYLSRGNLYYCSAGGAAAQKLNPNVPVTDYWWSPRGNSLAYKVTNGTTLWGDIRIVDLASRDVTWDLGRQVTNFNFSPDGLSWVASYPVNTNGVESANHVIVGPVGQPASAGHEFDIIGDNTPQNSTGQLDDPNMPRHAIGVYDGLYWLGDSIYLSAGEGTFATVHRFTSSGDSLDGYTQATSALLAQFDNQPASSAFSLVLSGQAIKIDYGGTTKQLNRSVGPGRPVVLSVSPDGRTALVTFLTPAGLDIYLVTADGQLQALSTDGASSLARWRPGGS